MSSEVCTLNLAITVMPLTVTLRMSSKFSHYILHYEDRIGYRKVLFLVSSGAIIFQFESDRLGFKGPKILWSMLIFVVLS